MKIQESHFAHTFYISTILRYYFNYVNDRKFLKEVKRNNQIFPYYVRNELLQHSFQLYMLHIVALSKYTFVNNRSKFIVHISKDIYWKCRQSMLIEIMIVNYRSDNSKNFADNRTSIKRLLILRLQRWNLKKGTFVRSFWKGSI